MRARFGCELLSLYASRAARLPLPSALVAAFALGSAPALAGPIDTAYMNAMMPYVVLKRGTVECGKPAGEHIAYKTRMLNILAHIPNVDLIAADREIERAFEREAPMTGSGECSDALLERYTMAREGGAERALDYLAETVRDR